MRSYSYDLTSEMVNHAFLLIWNLTSEMVNHAFLLIRNLTSEMVNHAFLLIRNSVKYQVFFNTLKDFLNATD